MIQINDSDLPIEVAQKLIYSTTTSNFFGKEICSKTFDNQEIAELRDYLTAYLNNHKEGANE